MTAEQLGPNSESGDSSIAPSSEPLPEYLTLYLKMNQCFEHYDMAAQAVLATLNRLSDGNQNFSDEQNSRLHE